MTNELYEMDNREWEIVLERDNQETEVYDDWRIKTRNSKWYSDG